MGMKRVKKKNQFVSIGYANISNGVLHVFGIKGTSRLTDRNLNVVAPGFNYIEACDVGV